MRKKIIIILYILSFTVALFIFAYMLTKASRSMTPDSYTSLAESGSRVYYAQNTPSKGLLFSMTKSGKVVRMYNTGEFKDSFIRDMSVYGNSIYLLLVRFDDEEEDFAAKYRVVRLDDKLNMEARSREFTIGETERADGFSAEPDGIFITALCQDGSYARVYGIKESDLYEEGDPDDYELRVENIRSRRSGDNRFFCQAEYAYGQLYVRTDEDVPEGRFAINTEAWNAASELRLSLGQFLSLYSVCVIWFFAAVIVWFITLSILLRALLHRNRTTYFLIVAELVLFLIFGLATISVGRIAQDNRRTEHVRFAALELMSLGSEAGLHEYDRYSLNGFYEMPRYQEIRQALADFVLREGNNLIFHDVLAVRLRDNLVLASASGQNLQSVTSIYGEELGELVNAIFRGGRYAAADLYIEGQKYTAVAVADADVSADYALVTIINAMTDDGSVYVDNRGVFLCFLMIWAFGAAVTALVWHLQLRDYRMLEKALSDTALGRTINERPVVIGRDLKDMWDSIFEINKRIEGIEYNRMRILEAYYRFAPKNVEKMLGRESITEVCAGDARNLSGTIAMLGIDLRHETNLKRIDSVIGQIGEYQKDHNVIMIGRAPDMSRVQLLFMENENKTVQFLTELFNHSTRSGDRLCYSAFLHYDNCLFTVLGTEEESAIRLSFDTQKVQEEISTFISKLQLGLVISESIKIRERVDAPLRFIGSFDAGERREPLRLYEMLDTYPAAERARRIRTLEKYNEALNLYYEKDFYFARTRFSEILKENPDDMLIKWYVFESDRYLNEGVEDDSYRMLHNDRGGNLS